MKKLALLSILLLGFGLLCACGGGGSAGPSSGVATHFSVKIQSSSTAGGVISFTVTALDASGNPTGNYTGTLMFASSDLQAALPANSMLTSGSGTFTVTLKTAGGQTITVTDTVNFSISGTSLAITVSPAAASQLSISVPGSATEGTAFSITVSALDPWKNVTPSYSGTVQFSSSDPNHTLPPNSPLANGMAIFTGVILNTPGSQTITGADTVTHSIAGTSSPITVSAPVPLAITSGQPPNGTAGVAYAGFHPECGRSAYSGFRLLAVGGTAPYTWTESSQASGLRAASITILVSSVRPPGCMGERIEVLDGTPTVPGTFDVSISVTDSATPPVTITKTYSVTINDPPPPVVSTNPAPNDGALNQSYSFTFSGAGYGSLAWSETGMLPPGLAFDNSNGMLSGIPTQTGSFPIAVTATDQFHQLSVPANFTIQVFPHGFALTGSMATARRFHTATLLGNGNVLVTGGTDCCTGAFASAELFNTTTDTFAPTGSMTVARIGQTATLLNTGKVLVTGGSSSVAGAAISTAELYDPLAGTFAATGSMVAARVFHTATLLKDGTVLVAGGDSFYFNGTSAQSLASAEIYNPATGTFAATVDMTAAREWHTATLLSTGEVLLAGGSQGTLGYSTVTTVLATSELFDPSKATFTASGTMDAARVFQSATALSSNGKVLVAGGTNLAASLATAELFDSASGSFSATGSMAAERFYHRATLLKDGTVLMTGGNDPDNTGLSSAELFDSVAATFSLTGGMTTPRVWHTATLLNDGRVLVTGGANGSTSPVATAEIYQ